jgi:hypothetical protein
VLPGRCLLPRRRVLPHLLPRWVLLPQWSVLRYWGFLTTLIEAIVQKGCPAILALRSAKALRRALHWWPSVGGQRHLRPDCACELWLAATDCGRMDRPSASRTFLDMRG